MALDKQDPEGFFAWVGFFVVVLTGLAATVFAVIGFCMVFYGLFIGNGHWEWVNHVSK